MKSKILALALVVVIAAVAVVCISCSRKEDEFTNELISFKVINQCGEKITGIVMDDTRSVSKLESKPEGDGWAEGDAIEFSITAAMKDNAPDLQFTVTTESGKNLTTSILQKDLCITVLSGEDGLRTQEEPLAK